jgi:hypothetical protein
MDPISFEDLVVQPYNSYFNLEKELHDVKAKLSLMEQRLKYLEKHAKDTDLKQEIDKRIQNDYEVRKKNEEEMIKRKEELEKERKRHENEEFEKWYKERKFGDGVPLKYLKELAIRRAQRHKG